MRRSSLVYITGTPGSGKSAVCNELRRRGYTAYDTDEDAIAFFYDNVTGKPVERQVPAEDRTPEWRAQHTWKARRDTVEELMTTAECEPVFLCGVTANDACELWDLFSKVFALVVRDEQVLRGRIADRSADSYGKNPHELAALLHWQRTAAADYEKLGAILVDASRPLEEVVTIILTQMTNSSDPFPG
jgi:AAA domain